MHPILSWRMFGVVPACPHLSARYGAKIFTSSYWNIFMRKIISRRKIKKVAGRYTVQTLVERGRFIYFWEHIVKELYLLVEQILSRWHQESGVCAVIGCMICYLWAEWYVLCSPSLWQIHFVGQLEGREGWWFKLLRHKKGVNNPLCLDITLSDMLCRAA